MDVYTRRNDGECLILAFLVVDIYVGMDSDVLTGSEEQHQELKLERMLQAFFNLLW